MNSIKNTKLLYILFIFFICSIYIFINYSYGTGNHTEQIPVIKRFIDSSYLKNDWFINQNQGFSVRYYFYSLMAYLADFADLSIIYFIIYLITLFSIISAIYLISYYLFKNNLTSFLTIFLILFSAETSLGGNWLVRNHLIPSLIAHAFALFAIYFFIKRKKYIPFLLLGIASLFHILVGMLVAVTLFFILFIRFVIHNIDLKEILISIVCYLLFAVWNLLPIILLNISNVSSLIVAKIIGHVRSPWHYMPFQFSKISYLLFFAVLCLFIISLRYKPEKEKHRTVISFILAIIIMCIIGTIFVEIIFIPIIVKLQLFRITPYLILFMYMYIANYFRIALKKREMAKLTKINKIIPYLNLVIILIIIAIGCITYMEEQKDFSEIRAYKWIRLNTPKDTIFITPPYIDNFRLGADRAIIVDFKSFPYDDQSIIEWKNRIDDLTNNIIFKFRGNRINELRDGFMSLDESDFIRVSKKYNAPYLFIEKPKKLNFEILYENDKYIVYRLPYTIL